MRDPFVIKSIVTSDLGAEIAKNYGVKMLETLTGFKFIGQKMTQFQLSGSHEFIMGYEESYGYLVGGHARDKDAVVAAMLIAEMAAYYKAQGKTLSDALEGLYQAYGYYVDEVQSFTLEGISGQERIGQIMQMLRAQVPDTIGGLTVAQYKDYRQGWTSCRRQTSSNTFLPRAAGWRYVLPAQSLRSNFTTLCPAVMQRRRTPCRGAQSLCRSERWAVTPIDDAKDVANDENKL